MRVHELAKKVSKSSKEILAVSKSLSIEVKSHMSTLDDEALGKVLGALGLQSLPGKDVKVAEQPKPAKQKKASSGGKKAEPKKKDKQAKSADDVKKKIAEKLSRAKQAAPKKVEKKQQTKADKKKEAKSAEPQADEQPKSEFHSDKEIIKLRLPITVGGLATNMEVKNSALIKALMQEGIFANVNQLLNEEIVNKVTEKFGVLVDVLPSEEEELMTSHEDHDDPKDLKLRPPVVTLMGHVDHGKTSLLDAIRDSRVADRESGKITQHIGAYAVPVEKGTVTFLDTPGHEAFTAMRARGANVTDVVVLVVAADDGVMPQTIEAINHAKAANVPIVVAINKSDLPSADPNRVKSDLQKYELVSEDWGGSTVMVNVSALKRTGIDELLELLLLESEILELKANPDRTASGVVLEAKITKSHGTATTILVTNGTLKIGDNIICGSFFGKVRAMHNDRMKNIRTAGPSTPVEIYGIQGVPQAADKFFVVEDEKQARRIAEQKTMNQREKDLNSKLMKHTSLDSFFEKVEDGKMTELKIIIKADVQGSVEVLQQSLEKLSNEKIRLKVIHAAAGGINESDVILAAVSDAIIIGFHVKAGLKAQAAVDREKVDVRYYHVIYEAVEDVKTAMEGKLAPTFREVTTGMIEIRDTFKASKVGTIGGGYVVSGKVARSNKLRVIRDDIVVFEGSFGSLKRFKDDVREVKEGYECGLTVNNFNDLKAGDMIEAYTTEEVATKLN